MANVLKFCTSKFDKMAYVNSANPDQIAPEGFMGIPVAYLGPIVFLKEKSDLGQHCLPFH